jgi:L-iditol 2-dehydrogenase
MKAALLKAPGLLEYDDLPDPSVPDGGALLKIKACAVCGTDVKMRALGHRDLGLPRVLGHEMVGRIVELNSRSSGLSEGNLVQVWPGIACGKCRPCRRGRDSRCQSIKIMGFNCHGGFAELLALPGECFPSGVNLLPGNADPALAALAEPLACCMNGQEQVRVCEGDRILILGGGPIGALHALLAAHQGAEKVMVAEKLPERVRLLKKHTRAVVVNPDEERLHDVLAAETDGEGADVIVAATPSIPMDNDLLHLLSSGGRACVFSGPAAGHHQERIDLRDIHYREIAVSGAYGCTSLQNRFAVELIMSGQIRADWLITRRTSLAEIEEAFSHSEKRGGMKSVVYPG